MVLNVSGGARFLSAPEGANDAIQPTNFAAHNMRRATLRGGFTEMFSAAGYAGSGRAGSPLNVSGADE